MSAPAYLSPLPAPTPQSPPETPPETPADSPRCPNCGTPATRNFCPECGQECISVRLGLRDLLHEFLDDHVGWSTKVPRTMSRLLLRPGALTLDFIEGRRARYLSPLRLYLSLSVIFFLVVASPPRWGRDAARSSHAAISFGKGQKVRLADGDSGESETAAARTARLAKVDSLNADIARKMPDTTLLRGRLKAQILRRNVELARMTAKERTQAFVGGLTSRMPDVMFVLLPLFALMIKWLYWRRKRFYAEHFIFALHVHAVAYALLTIGIVSPWRPAIPILFVWCAVYFVLALRRVYGGSVFRTLVRTTILGTVYGFIVSMAALSVTAFVYLIG